MSTNLSPSLCGLAEFFNDGQFSDIKITCKDKVINAHKIVLCSQSKVFKASCTAGFKSLTSTIDLSNKEQQLIEAMVIFLYRCDYPDKPPHSGQGGYGQGIQLAKLLYHVDIFAMADRFDIPALGELVKAKYEESTKPHWTQDDTISFLESIPKSYATTPESNRGLRDSVVGYVMSQEKIVTGDFMAKARFEGNILHNSITCGRRLAEEGSLP